MKVFKNSRNKISKSLKWKRQGKKKGESRMKKKMEKKSKKQNRKSKRKGKDKKIKKKQRKKKKMKNQFKSKYQRRLKKTRKHFKDKKKRKEQKGTKESVKIDAECIVQFTFMLKRKDIVSNFQKQSKRIGIFLDQTLKKLEKKNVFQNITKKMIAIGGGNESSLECGGSNTSPTSQNFTLLVKNLDDCEGNIEKSCNLTRPNMTLINDCTNLTEKFIEHVDNCSALSKNSSKVKEACNCWTGKEIKDLSEKIKSCSFNKYQEEIKDNKTECLKTFGKCRAEERRAVEILSICSPGPAEMMTIAMKLHSNKETLPKVQQKIDSLIGSSKMRIFRARIETCSDIIMKTEECE